MPVSVENQTWHSNRAHSGNSTPKGPWDSSAAGSSSIMIPMASGRMRSAHDLEGTWVNMDVPREQYVVEGLRVTRMGVRGTQHFTLAWDQSRQRLSWGTHGRLFLEWLHDDAITWNPEFPGSSRGAAIPPPPPPHMGSQSHVHPPRAPPNQRVWRWQRISRPNGQETHSEAASSGSGSSVPVPPSTPPPGVSGYGPLRRSRGGSSNQNWDDRRSAPYLSTPQNNSNSGWDNSSAGNRHSGGGSHSAGHRRHGHREHSQQQSQRDHRSDRQHRGGRDHHWRPRGGYGGDRGSPLACGLTSMEMFDLLSRDLTPEDYEVLLRLDEKVPKPTASTDCIEALPAVSAEEFMGGSCTVCMSSFEESDSVAAIDPCKHNFHRDCIAKWLAQCKKTCPLCGVEATAA